MSKQLRDNIKNMTHAELIGLAKNRFLPGDMQMSIAQIPYAIGRRYLTENTGLNTEVRDYLWSNQCNRGYSLKASLLCNGHYDNEPEKFWELYENYQNAWVRSAWLMSDAFLGSVWQHHHRRMPGSGQGTPSDLLNKIYDDMFSPQKRDLRREHLQFTTTLYQFRYLARHPNVDLPLAIKLSQCGVEEIQKIGFQKIISLS